MLIPSFVIASWSVWRTRYFVHSERKRIVIDSHPSSFSCFTLESFKSSVKKGDQPRGHRAEEDRDKSVWTTGSTTEIMEIPRNGHEGLLKRIVDGRMRERTRVHVAFNSLYPHCVRPRCEGSCQRGLLSCRIVLPPCPCNPTFRRSFPARGINFWPTVISNRSDKDTLFIQGDTKMSDQILVPYSERLWRKMVFVNRERQLARYSDCQFLEHWILYL